MELVIDVEVVFKLHNGVGRRRLRGRSAVPSTRPVPLPDQAPLPHQCGKATL